MRLNQFRALKKNSLQLSTIPSTDRNYSPEKLMSRGKRQNPFLIRKAKFIIQYIKQRSSPQKQQQSFPAQQSPEICPTEKEVLEKAKYQSESADQGRPQEKRKISRNFSSIDSENNLKNSRMRNQMQKRRQAFLKNCGYLQNKNSTVAIAKQKRQTIQIVPNIEECNERLFLDDVEAMKVERSIQQYSNNRKRVRRSRREKQLLNRTINEAERKLSEQEGRQTTQSVSFEKTKKMMSMMSMKTAKKQINIDQVLNSLSRCSNKIYGKRHESDSIVWCTQVLKAQLEDQFTPYSQILEKRKKRGEKQGKSHTLSPIKAFQQRFTLQHN